MRNPELHMSRAELAAGSLAWQRWSADLNVSRAGFETQRRAFLAGWHARVVEEAEQVSMDEALVQMAEAEP